MASAPPLVQPFTDDSHPNDQASALGIFIEPLVVVSLLAAGVIINRRPLSPVSRAYSPIPSPTFSPTSHTRHSSLRFFKPWDTSRYANNWVSATLYRFPFILEVFYWGLTYWVYQIARAVSAVLFIDDGTVDIARRHAIQLLEFERRLGIQWENKVQDTIMQHAWALSALNRIYSFIHIPATIAFLAYFYHTQPFRVYAPVRRTMALANLLAFVVFTLWPCMPPRLLPAAYSFVDTVHKHGAGSVWTTNRFCNPLAAMPSLHFGYSLIVGVALCAHPPTTTQHHPRRAHPHHLRALFLLYPALILLAIVATANHYLLDALAGLVVVALARYANAALVPLLALENAVLRLLHIHKPSPAHLVESQSVQDVLPRFAEDALKHPEDYAA
ncbi:PAP2 superfamily-domain-containing protein [Lactarius pseudohatsudake]|nr:PAP2 superfamily-domain-containing protein [Lactarius pseudohatsudake]